MSKNSFRPLADFPHAGELLLAIRSLSHRFPGQGRHVFLTASTNGPDVEILTMKYGAIPVPDIRRLYPRDQVCSASTISLG
jgi:plasmid stabilization system protein ParE